MKKIISAKTRDVAFQFRMGAGFPGEVSRTHPVDILPSLIDSNAPPTAYGQGVIIDATTSGVRPIATSGDTGVTALYGVTVRPYPFQQAQTNINYGGTENSSSGAIATIAPPVSGEIDVLVRGFIIVYVGNYAANPPVKGNQVYIWYAASSGNHTQGAFEAAATGGSTIAIGSPNGNGAATFGQNVYWNSGVDAYGYAELAFDI